MINNRMLITTITVGPLQTVTTSTARHQSGAKSNRHTGAKSDCHGQHTAQRSKTRRSAVLGSRRSELHEGAPRRLRRTRGPSPTVRESTQPAIPGRRRLLPAADGLRSSGDLEAHPAIDAPISTPSSAKSLFRLRSAAGCRSPCALRPRGWRRRQSEAASLGRAPVRCLAP